MIFSAENPLTQSATTEKPYNTTYVLGMCALLLVCILGRAVSNLFVYVFMAVSGVVFLLSSPKHCVTMLFFLMPFSYFLKPSPNGMSFFTVLFFLTIAKMVLVHKKVSLMFFLSAAAFVVYHLLFSGLRELTIVITMVAGALMLFYAQYERVDIKTTVLVFSAGICLASVLASLSGSLPLVNSFVKTVTLKMGAGEYQSRFAGFSGNPNFYTMGVVMAQSALLVLMYREKKQILYIACFAVLSIFGFMSVSKSFLLAWGVLIFFWFILSVKKGVGGVVKFVFVAALGIVAVSYFAYDYLMAYVNRFLQDSSGAFSNVTTGRTDIWSEYMDVFFSDMKILFFGNGIKTVLSSKATHNTYIESIFYFGVIGTVILCVMLKAGLQKVITSKIMWIPILTLLIRLFAISYVTHDELWFYLAMIVFLKQYCSETVKQETVEKGNQEDETIGGSPDVFRSAGCAE